MREDLGQSWEWLLEENERLRQLAQELQKELERLKKKAKEWGLT